MVNTALLRKSSKTNINKIESEHQKTEYNISLNKAQKKTPTFLLKFFVGDEGFEPPTPSV
jgi:hypothetical protein